MSDALIATYEDVPWQGAALQESHPNLLATVARLAGMSPAPIDACRVLELGCADGSNLIPMAESLPGSRFVGVDLTPGQIARGASVIETLRLGNIDLQARSLLELPAELGEFDYVICHGVYSWVPRSVQERILQVCRERVAPQGVVYVSYATYPGWHQTRALREMMLYHLRGIGDGRQRVEAARAFADRLAASASDRDGAYARMLVEQAAIIAGYRDDHLAHDHLELEVRPVWFHELAAEAEAAGLQYIDDAWHIGAQPHLAPAARDLIAPVANDPIRAGQYLDFLENRAFRRSVLCRREVAIVRPHEPRAMDGLSIVPLAAPQSERPSLRAGDQEAFEGRLSAITTGEPLLKATLVALNERRPRALAWVALREAVPTLLGRALDEGALRETVLSAYRANLLGLEVWEPPFVAEASSRPRVRALTRLQAAAGPLVTDARHGMVELDDVDRELARNLDGTHDRRSLVELLRASLKRRGVVPHRDGRPIHDKYELRDLLGVAVEESLAKLAACCLLVA